MSMVLSIAVPTTVGRGNAREGEATKGTMDEGSFRGFYDRTAGALRAYLARASGSWQLADDLVQESYYRFLRSGFAGSDERHRKNYLYRIGTNLVRDHYRRHRPTTDRLPEAGGEPGHDDRIQLRFDMADALSELGGRDRQLLWLAYVEGASHREVASILGLKEGSIRPMMFRARQRLAKLLRERGFAPERESHDEQ
jgi:RNA polymerase sigma-70 factor (ECF subfamily)